MEQIEVKNLSFSYPCSGGRQGREVLKGISFSVSDHESIGLIGANGVGKSTLLKLLVGLQTEYVGELTVCKMPVRKGHLAQIRQKTGYVFQDSDSQLFLSTVYEDVAFAPRNYGLSEELVKEYTQKAMAAVHIESLADRQIYRLSGGEKKLASIATILSTSPDIILLDEPSVALDPANRRNLIHVINEMKCIKVIASHDLDFIYDTCERTILLSREGTVAQDGNTKQLLQNKTLLEAHGLELPLSFSRV